MTATPLAGRTVVVTRPREQAGDLASRLEARGAAVLLAPAVEIVAAPRGALERAARHLSRGRYAWVVLTSRAGVDALFPLLEGAELRARVAAIGEGTAAALSRRGVEPDLVPRTFTTTALGRAMPRGEGEVLLARADIAPEGLESVLEERGWTPVRIDAYATRLARSLPVGVERALAGGAVDAVTFSSASTVDGFVGCADPHALARRARPAFVCIGPVTADRARDRGLAVAAVARPHTIEGLVVAVERALARRVPRTSDHRKKRLHALEERR